MRKSGKAIYMTVKEAEIFQDFLRLHGYKVNVNVLHLWNAIEQTKLGITLDKQNLSCFQVNITNKSEEN